jgi:hypothetical protein
MGTSTRVRPLSRSVKTSTTHQNRTNKTRHKHTREPAPQKIPPHLENLSRPTHFPAPLYQTAENVILSEARPKTSRRCEKLQPREVE